MCFSAFITNCTVVKKSCLHSEPNITCVASGMAEVTIDCEGIEEGSNVQCSFDNGRLHPCMPV